MVVKPAIEPLRLYKNGFRKASVLSYLVQFPNYQKHKSKVDVLCCAKRLEVERSLMS